MSRMRFELGALSWSGVGYFRTIRRTGEEAPFVLVFGETAQESDRRAEWLLMTLNSTSLEIDYEEFCEFERAGAAQQRRN